ncbi:PepSY domain-containing protein [Thalassospira sp.]|uniref:PepSY domain-containing protein n=1 Tax=Thalassospira sp. TaxID=1912094 RepID=UPI001B1BABD4|nr:PepSY domain-containing protein [Thalassospira sp.]MBO6807676.1 PepSY domain-containing protein [Thalassospira sp.]MBO6840201.1 PepSY domain-containing protein [Thalassospira sp.]
MKNTVLKKAALGSFAATLLATAALGLTAHTAQASDDYCNVPKSEWQSMDALKEKLTAEGWDVRKIKEDDGCYEVYAIKANGKKVEAYFNPATFELVKEDD